MRTRTSRMASTACGCDTLTRLEKVQHMTAEGQEAAELRREARAARIAERRERLQMAASNAFDRRVMSVADYCLARIKQRAKQGKSTYTYKAGRRGRYLRKVLNEVMVELADFNPRFRGKTIRKWYYGGYYYGYSSYTERHARLDFSW
jgi:hypothetical protein